MGLPCRRWRPFPAAAVLLLLLHVPAAASDRGLDLAGPSPLSDEALGTYHALIVGINAYQEWNPLQTAVKDAAVLRDILVKRYGFNEENVVLRTDHEATRLRILQDLRSMASSLGDSDNLLVYFAGHGQLDDLTGDGYWIPVEGKLKNPGTWISHGTLKGILGSEKVRAKNVVVVVDSCYSGTLLRGGPSLLKMDERSYEDKLAEAASRRSRQVITSGGLEPVTDGGRDGHSLFAFYLLRALRENDRKVVDLENLFHTRVWEPVTSIGDQRPNVGRLKSPMDEDGQFVLKNQSLIGGAETSSLRQEAPARKRLEEELARLEAERSRLEQERKVLEAKKKLEAERLALEREKQRLALETERKRLELEKVRTKEGAAREAKDVQAAPLPQPRDPDPGKITVAALPWHFNYRCQWTNRIDTDYTHLLVLEELLEFKDFRMTHSCYPSENTDHEIQRVRLDPGDAERLWVKKGFFSEPELDVQAAAELGRELGVDSVFMTQVRNSMDCKASFRLFLVDTATGEVMTEKELSSGYRSYAQVLERVVQRLLRRRLAADRE